MLTSTLSSINSLKLCGLTLTIDEDEGKIAEKTEVLYGFENILKFMLPRYPSIKQNIDACYDYSGPPDVVKVEPVWQELVKLEKRGIKIRFLTDMREENIESCKKFLSLKTLEMRHLDGIKGNFGIADRREFLEHIINREDEPLTHAIFSTAKGIVDARQFLFDNLWKKAIPIEDRIKEIEEGIKPSFIETIRDPKEIQNIVFEMIKSAQNEIQIIFPTAMEYLRQEKIGIIKPLREKTIEEENSIIKVRLIIPIDIKKLKVKVKEYLEHATNHRKLNIGNKIIKNKIEIQFLEPNSETIISTLIVDRKLLLAVELKNDTKLDYSEAVGLGTYSNSESIVLSYASIFETYWVKSELSSSKESVSLF